MTCDGIRVCRFGWQAHGTFRCDLWVTMCVDTAACSRDVRINLRTYPRHFQSGRLACCCFCAMSAYRPFRPLYGQWQQAPSACTDLETMNSMRSVEGNHLFKVRPTCNWLMGLHPDNAGPHSRLLPDNGPSSLRFCCTPCPDLAAHALKHSYSLHDGR